ncbi:MAG: aldehyde dehydrogenase family protein [Candidatus Sulfotelmatobacter sp.]
MYIAGEWTASATGRTFDTLDPGTGERLTTVAAGNATDVDRAVKSAQQAFAKSGWSTMPASERAVLLHRLADLIEKRVLLLSEIESRDVGKPRGQAIAFDIPHAAKTLRYYADLSVHTRKSESIAVAGLDARSIRQPYGVCGFIFPWNFPFLLVGWGIAPALAAGNTVVIKPAEDTPLSTLYFAKLAEEVGIPPGVINVVTGLGETAGAALAAHPGIKRMSFTGSPEVGRLVGQVCAGNLVPVKLELGGKGAAVIFEDAAMESAAEALVAAVTLNAGQVCCTATRWLVHARIADRFIDKASSLMSNLKIGYGGDAQTQIGPLVSEKQRQRVLSYIRRGQAEGATAVLAGGLGEVPGFQNGFYVKPALLSGPPENICAREEIFGPVAYVMTFRDEAEAVELVNRSPYGFANSVWSADLSRAICVSGRLIAGNSWINAHNVFAHGVPYGGCNLSGCGGGVPGPDTLDDYFRKQSVVRPLA